MTIPIRNLYYLLCYAWDTLEQLDQIDVGESGTHDTANLCARLLVHGVNDLLRRGLDREYVECSDDIAGIRGRIDFGTTTRRLLLSRAQTHCRFDELSLDVLHNRIIRETVRVLGVVRGLHPENRSDLHALWMRLDGVTQIRLDAGLFGRVRLHRNNARYRFLVELCRLIHASTLMDERGDRATFLDFSREESMNILFESFVRRFLQRHLGAGFSVGRRIISWQAAEANPDALSRLPNLETDVVVDGPQSTLIIDAKYYSKPLARPRFEGSKAVFDAKNINQMFVYVTNFEKVREAKPVEGLILYAGTDDVRDLRDEYRLHGRRIRVATLDLAAEWDALHAQLLSLVKPDLRATRTVSLRSDA